jgi:Uma2 family endonuclease
MATTTVPADVMARLFDEDGPVQYELVNGNLEAMAVSNLFHGIIAWWLASLLAQQTGDDVLVSVDVHSKIDEENWRRPDIIAIRAEDVEGWKYVMPGHWPFLCIEIVSAPDQTAEEMFRKCEVYHAQGVSYCWVLEPISRTAWTYHKGQKPIWISSEGGELDAGAIRIALTEVWRGLKNRPIR